MSDTPVKTNYQANIEFKLGARTYKPAYCDDNPTSVSIPDDGVGIWKFEMSETEVKVSLNGKDIVSDTQDCLLEHVHPAKWIMFSGKDDVSQEFRFIPGKKGQL